MRSRSLVHTMALAAAPEGGLLNAIARSARARARTMAVGFLCALLATPAYAGPMIATAPPYPRRPANGAACDSFSRTSSTAALATSSSSLEPGTTLYQATFFSGDWSGNLRAFRLDAMGAVSGSPVWNAADGIAAPKRRNIVTYRNGRGVAFRWDQLSKSEQAALDATGRAGKATLQYLRGVRAEEAPRGSFRRRSPETVLGDIIHSNPLFVHDEDYGYSALPGPAGRAYYPYLRSRQKRKSVIYVGANDGMLPAFDANNGWEIFAYVPRALYAALPALADSGYDRAHQYYVDGSPTAGDAFIDGHWGTYLLGSLGAGGRGIFALNVTDPGNLGPVSVLWSFSAFSEHGNAATTPCHFTATGADCSSAVIRDLGFTIPGATIARMNNGEWVALIPNGYASPAGKATLFIVDLATGRLVRELFAGSGPGNGLSGVAAVDYNGDRSVDYIYAGDLKGNLWKFNVSSTAPSKWKIAYGHQQHPQPLFIACGSSSCTDRQAITTRPAVTRDPDGGLIILFGTGRVFAAGDNKVARNAPIQSLYGIRDETPAVTGGTTPVVRADLLRQAWTAPVSDIVAGYAIRTSTAQTAAPAQAGWYLDLPLTGERSIVPPVLHGHRVEFTTMVPGSPPCGTGGKTYLMTLTPYSGSRPSYNTLDLNGDGLLTPADEATRQVATGRTTRIPVSGMQSPAFMQQPPLTISAPGRQARIGSSMAGKPVNLPTTPSVAPRPSWVQLR